MAKDAILQSCTMLESLSNRNSKVELENGQVITCTINGKIRSNHIRIIPDNHVKVEMNPYDLTKGRISKRVIKTKTPMASKKRPKSRR